MAKVTVNKADVKGQANVSFANAYGKTARRAGNDGTPHTAVVIGFTTSEVTTQSGEKQNNVYVVATINGKKARFRPDEEQFEQLEVGSNVTLTKRINTIEGREVHYFELETINAASAVTAGAAASAVTA